MVQLGVEARHLERSKGPITENLKLDVYFVVSDPFNSQNVAEIVAVVSALSNYRALG
jgi:hypothetical protein